MENARSVSQAFFNRGRPDPSVKFDVTPRGSEGIDQSTLEIDGQVYVYSNEKEIAESFTWPGETPMARIHAVIGGDIHPGIGFDGPWALFRLLKNAQITQQSPVEYSMSWPLDSSTGQRFYVRYTLRAVSVDNPLSPNFFAHLRCPETITRAASGRTY
jgi:type VI protein secretion system component VasK